LSIAVAGFSKNDIEVSVDNGSLVIKGEIVEVTDAEVVHKGIASRKFTRSFALGEYMEVTGAELKDGMLHINVDRIVPEEKKPKPIKIK
jgi:molecular chaperone IbpA